MGLPAAKAKVRECRNCGCTEEDCSGCIAKTGKPCRWVERDLCSACVTWCACGKHIGPIHPRIKCAKCGNQKCWECCQSGRMDLQREQVLRTAASVGGA